MSKQGEVSVTELLLGTSPDRPEDPPMPEASRLGHHTRARPKSLRATAKRERVLALTVVDQAASSASNFGVAFIVAHYSDARDLGIFAIVSTTYILTQGLIRSLTSDCLLTRHDSDESMMATYERAGFLSALVYSVVASVLMLIISLAFSPQLRLTFVILACSLPLLAAQDYARYIGISRFNPAYAVWLDTVWTVLFVAAFVVLRHEGHVTLPWIYAAWGATGSAVGLYALWNHLPLRHYRQLLSFWWRSERGVGLRFAGQWMLGSSWVYVAVYLFALIFSVAVIGQFKLAQLVFGPITVMTQGIATALVALAARYFQLDVGKALRFVLLAGLGTAGITVAWLVGVLVVPEATLTKILGPAWPAARQLVPLMGLAFALTCIASAAAAGLRSIRAAKLNLRVALAMTPVLFACCMTGGAVWGIKAAVAGLCVGFVINCAVWWWALVHAARRLPPSDPAHEVDAESEPPAAFDAPAFALGEAT